MQYFTVMQSRYGPRVHRTVHIEGAKSTLLACNMRVIETENIEEIPKDIPKCGHACCFGTPPTFKQHHVHKHYTRGK